MQPLEQGHEASRGASHAGAVAGVVAGHPCVKAACSLQPGHGPAIMAGRVTDPARPWTGHAGVVAGHPSSPPLYLLLKHPDKVLSSMFHRFNLTTHLEQRGLNIIVLSSSIKTYLGDEMFFQHS